MISLFNYIYVLSNHVLVYIISNTDLTILFEGCLLMTPNSMIMVEVTREFTCLFVC